MRKQGRTIAVFLSLAISAVAAAHGADLKFRTVAGPEPVIGHYVVTLADSVAADLLEASAEVLAQSYVGQLEPDRSVHARQFAIAMLPARARTLSADPRVREVVEIAQADDAEVLPPLSAAPFSPSGLDRQHFVPAVRDTYSVGTYTYDGAGNITAIGADTYAYDTAQRLLRSVTRGVEEDYTYDAFGNRQSATGAINCLGQTTCAQPVTVDSNTNHLTTINNVNVTYDAAGNIATISGSPGAVYSYDGTGMLTEATVGSDDRQFIYTADGERIAVRQGASWTWTVRDLSGKVLREFTSLETGPNLAMTNRQWVKDYVWRDGLLLATVTPSGTLHYHLDHLGTPRLVTDGNGVKVAEHAYYPFGAEINLTPHETPEEAMKFTGHERDIVAGDGHTLDYMHARFYTPNVGRFLSVDPDLNLKAAIHTPQKWNRYSYVVNNPIVYRDPTGKQEAAGFAMDRDVQDLIAHRITEKEYWARLNARGVGALIGAAPWAAYAYGPGALATLARLGEAGWFQAKNAISATTSVMLGQTMSRVRDAASETGSLTFETESNPQVWWTENKAFLQSAIDKGMKIFDIGSDPAKSQQGYFHSLEESFLTQQGYQRVHAGLVFIQGELTEVFQWVPKPQ